MPVARTRDIDEARLLAEQALPSFVLNETPEGGSLSAYYEDWSLENIAGDQAEGGAIFADEPVVILDIYGSTLFYEFSRPLANGKQLRARSTGVDTLACPVASMAISAPLDYAPLVERARDRAAELQLQVTDDSRLVCYSYPKIGIIAEQQGRRFAIDLASLAVVELDLDAWPEDPELATSWTPIPTGNDTQAVINRSSNILLSRAYGTLGGAATLAAKSEAARDSAAEYLVPGLVLTPQISQFYCALAVAQMILAFHGIQTTQEQIAEIMQPGPTGTLPSKQEAAIPVLSDNKLTALLDRTATFDEVRAEISQTLPLKDGIFAHARAIAGWKLEALDGVEAPWIYVYDPLPMGAGAIYWENWSFTAHTNSIYIRRA